MDNNILTGIIIDKAIKIHQKLGPGLFESIYEEVIDYELKKEGLKCLRQVVLPVKYDDLILKAGYRIDLLIEDKIIVELKSIETVKSIHKKQLLTYLKLSSLKVGLLINFNVVLLKHGIIRISN